MSARRIEFAVVLFCGLMAAACNGASEPTPFFAIVDEAGIIRRQDLPALNERLKQLSLTKDAQVIVQTTRAKPSREEAAVYVDELFSGSMAWRDAPVGMEQRLLRRVFCRVGLLCGSPKALHIVVVPSIKLVTVRFGADVRRRAMLSGLLGGAAFPDLQSRVARLPPRGALDQVIGHLEGNLKSRDALTRMERFVSGWLISDLDEIIDGVTLANWETYNSLLLEPTLRLSAAAAGRLPVRIWPLAVIGLVVLGVFLITSAIESVVDRRRPGHRLVYLLGIKLPLEIAGLIPVLGSLLLISYGRMEDRWFVASLVQTDARRLAEILAIGYDLKLGVIGAVFMSALAVLPHVLRTAHLIPLGAMTSKRQLEHYESLSWLDQGLVAAAAGNSVDGDEPFTGAAMESLLHALKRFGALTLIFLVLPSVIGLYFGVRGGVASILAVPRSVRSYRRATRFASAPA